MKKEWCQWALVIGAVFLAGVLLFDRSSEKQIIALESRIRYQRVENQLQRSKLVRLKREIDGISHDNRYLEQLARNKLALAQENDLIYLFQSK